MPTRTIHVTQFDYERLRQVLNEAMHSEYRGSEYLTNLEAELSRGKIVPPAEIPADVITMNSKVRLVDLEEGDEVVYTLVFPDEADLTANKVSVLAPMGTAMLGYRVGDVVELEAPMGVIRLKVEEVIYQPEASGDYHL